MKNIFLVYFLSVCSFQVNAEVSATELFNTINQRLSYMEDVALFKVNNHIAIEHIAREKIVVEKAQMSASEQGFDSEAVKGFFYAQIAVAKAIQYRVRADLLSQPLSHQSQDLQTEVRPALIDLDNQIIDEMALYLNQYRKIQDTQYAQFSEAITVKYVAEADKKLLFKALLNVNLI